MPTHTETAPSTTVFTAAWQGWHAAHERHRADPHGFLAVTHLHWLGAEPAALEGVPGTCSVKDDAITVVLAAGESLRPGRPVAQVPLRVVVSDADVSGGGVFCDAFGAEYLKGWKPPDIAFWGR